MADRSDVSIQFLANMASYMAHEVATGLDVAADEIERLRELNTELVDGLKSTMKYAEAAALQDRYYGDKNLDAIKAFESARELLKKVEG